MSEFIKGQVSERANAIEQVREILDRAETEARGLTVDDLGHVERLESRIADIDNGIAVARRQEERAADVAAAAGSFVPAVEGATIPRFFVASLWVKCVGTSSARL
jgi:hypothetical protein